VGHWSLAVRRPRAAHSAGAPSRAARPATPSRPSRPAGGRDRLLRAARRAHRDTARGGHEPRR
jgi:hypothetical protein